MTSLRNALRPVALAAAVIFATVPVVGTSLAATDTIYRYATPKIGYLTIDPMAMAADKPNGGEYHNKWDEGLTLGGGNSPRCFNTGINLPNGSKIIKTVIFYSSSGFGGDAYVELRRKALAGGDSRNIGTRLLKDDTATRKQVPLTHNSALAVIDNALYSYGLGVCLQSGDNIFYGARITYTYENAGD